jgi:transposase
MKPADLRRGFDKLAYMVQQALGENPLSGHLFLFINRRRNRIKALYWAGDGYVIWYKRLQRGTLELPRPAHADSVGLQITASQLSLILDGIELSSVRQRRRYKLSRAG